MTEAQSTKPKTISQTKAALIVGLMFAMFIVPNVYILYVYKTGELPDIGTNEKGTFFSPFISMHKHNFIALDEKHWQPKLMQESGKWVIMSFADHACEQTCFDSIFNSQQGISALTRYKSRVEHIILVNQEMSESEELRTINQLKQFSYLLEDQTLMPEIKEQLNRSSLNNTRVIVDPDSQLLLFYSEENSIQDVLRDLKRLLQSSITHYSGSENGED